MGVKVYVLPGNHDPYDCSEVLSERRKLLDEYRRLVDEQHRLLHGRLAWLREVNALIAKVRDLAQATSPSTSRPFAANLTSMSPVTPARLASSQDKIADHQRDGMLSRLRHLCTDASSAPTDAAIAAALGQSPITSRNEVIDLSMRRNVYSDKPSRNTREEQSSPLDQGGQNVLPFAPMGQEITQEDFVADLTARVKKAREKANFTQAQMAKLLDMEIGTYHKYECRTPMPHVVMIKFCHHTGVLIQELFYGKSHAAITVRAERRRRSS